MPLNLLSDAVHVDLYTDAHHCVSPRSIMYDADKKKGDEETTHISFAEWKHSKADLRAASTAS